jgi:acyl-CoA synthetase (AMP-forming)/AMP-acid ligase II
VHLTKATHLQYVGELCRYLLAAPPKPHDKGHNVRMAWGNGLRPDIWGKFRERFDIPIINELYAATDGMGASFNANEGDFSLGAIGVRGAIWNYLRGAGEVRVKIDIDTQEILRDAKGFAVKCPRNEPGEVLHKCDPAAPEAAFAGYYQNKGAGDKRFIRDVFEKGDLWFRSGDMMRVDHDGRLYFVDRLGDTFRWKSENVATNEVEDLLHQYPGVEEINVYGVLVPHADGRAGCAAVVLKDEKTFDWGAFSRFAVEQLPRYAVPIFVRITPEIQTTGTMKMQKGKMRGEGCDVEKVEATGDRLFWLKPGGDVYVPFGKEDYERVKEGGAKL